MSNHLDVRYDHLLKQIAKISDLKFKDEIPNDIYDLISELQACHVKLELQIKKLQNTQEN